LPTGLLTREKLAAVDFDVAALMPAPARASTPEVGAAHDATASPDRNASSSPVRSNS
jgi:hypothetical protein